VANGHGFAAPNQLRPAEPKVFPPSPRQVGGFAARGTVPSFHRQDAEAVANLARRSLDGPRQGRVITGFHRLVKWHFNAQFVEPLQKIVRRFETRKANAIVLQTTGNPFRAEVAHPAPFVLIFADVHDRLKKSTGGEHDGFSVERDVEIGVHPFYGSPFDQ